MDGALGTRAQLLNHRGFTLSFHVSGGERSEAPDMKGLAKGIQRHLAHWEPWWKALEDYLKFIHKDLDLEMDFFRCLWDPCSTSSNRSGIKGQFQSFPPAIHSFTQADKLMCYPTSYWHT